jgi:hypothetical protein
MITTIADYKKKFDNNELISNMSNNHILGKGCITRREDIEKSFCKIM